MPGQNSSHATCWIPKNKLPDEIIRRAVLIFKRLAQSVNMA
jgi:hypothetical protein